MGAPKLSDTGIDAAVKLLDGWAGKLTWERYLTVLELEIGHKYTKAAMLRHPRIADAWRHAKDRSSNVSEGGYGNVALSQAKARIKRLESRVERLERENNQLLEQFLRWSYNAASRGLTPEILDRPLPPGKNIE
jgi:predicted RNase H-like nuclease (RuvC/YqgF family)